MMDKEKSFLIMYPGDEGFSTLLEDYTTLQEVYKAVEKAISSNDNGGPYSFDDFRVIKGVVLKLDRKLVIEE